MNVWLLIFVNVLRIRPVNTQMSEHNAGNFKWSTGNVAEPFFRSKNVDPGHHHVREKVAEKTIELGKVCTGGHGGRVSDKDTTENRNEKCTGKSA